MKLEHEAIRDLVLDGKVSLVDAKIYLRLTRHEVNVYAKVEREVKVRKMGLRR